MLINNVSANATRLTVSDLYVPLEIVMGLVYSFQRVARQTVRQRWCATSGEPGFFSLSRAVEQHGRSWLLRSLAAALAKKDTSEASREKEPTLQTPPNFTLKLLRPGFGAPAEPAASSQA